MNRPLCVRVLWLLLLCFFFVTMSDVFRTILEKSELYDFDAVCKLWIGPKLIVFLFNPADVELILSSHVYIDKSAEYDFFKPWLGDGLLISTGKGKICIKLYDGLYIYMHLGPFVRWLLFLQLPHYCHCSSRRVLHKQKSSARGYAYDATFFCFLSR